MQTQNLDIKNIALKFLNWTAECTAEWRELKNQNNKVNKRENWRNFLQANIIN